MSCFTIHSEYLLQERMKLIGKHLSPLRKLNMLKTTITMQVVDIAVNKYYE